MPERLQPGRRLPAPHRLALVQDFINTNNLEEAEDEFATVDGLRDFFERKRLLEPGARLSEAERRGAVELREALRAFLLANNGAPLQRRAAETLNRYGAQLPLFPRFSGRGRAELAPASAGLGGALAVVLVRVYAAMEQGNWLRLKACQNLACQWAFYDHSKNQSGRWCTMSICGNRMKARAYIERRKARRLKSR